MSDRIPEVLNVRTVGKRCPGAVYIGRPGPWGNPLVCALRLPRAYPARPGAWKAAPRSH